MNRFEDAFGQWVVRHRWAIALAFGAALVFCISGVRFLRFDNDSRVFFGKDEPAYQTLDAIERTFTKNKNVVFAVAPAQGDVFNPTTLAAVEELTKLAWTLPYSSRVNSLTNFQNTRIAGDELTVADLVRNAAALSPEALREAKKIALAEPMLVNRLVSPSGDVTGVHVNFLLPGRSLDEVPQVAARARQIVEGLKGRYGGQSFYLTGDIMMDDAMAQASKDDMSTLFPGLFVIIFVIVGLAVRSILGAVCALVCIVLATAASVGVAGWLGIPFTTVSVNSPLIIVVFGVSDSIYLMVTAFRLMRAGRSRLEALPESLSLNVVPNFLTTLTTAVGFLTLNFSEVPPFRDIGNMVAIGAAVEFLCTALFLPSVLALLPLPVRQSRGATEPPRMKWLADFVIERKKLVFAGMTGGALAISFGLLAVDLNDDWTKYFSRRYEFRRDTDFVTSRLTGFMVIEYALNSGETDGINDPTYLRNVERFADWFRSQPHVIHVDTITNVVKRFNRDMHFGDPAYYRVPEARDLSAQYLLMYEMSLPFGMDLNDQINVDRSATRMVVTLRGASAREQRDLNRRAEQWLVANAPPSMATRGSSLAIIWAEISAKCIRNMLEGGLAGFAVIAAILVIAFRSLKIGLLSAIPNLLPAAVAFGLWGMSVQTIGLGLSATVSMTIGILFDDTIYCLSRYLRGRRREGMSCEEAVRYSYRTVGAVEWLKSVILVTGFLVIGLSGFKINSDMGRMSALILVFALVYDLLLTPVLMLLFDKGPYSDAKEKQWNETSLSPSRESIG